MAPSRLGLVLCAVGANAYLARGVVAFALSDALLYTPVRAGQAAAPDNRGFFALLVIPLANILALAFAAKPGGAPASYVPLVLRANALMAALLLASASPFLGGSLQGASLLAAPLLTAAALYTLAVRGRTARDPVRGVEEQVVPR